MDEDQIFISRVTQVRIQLLLSCYKSDNMNTAFDTHVWQYKNILPKWSNLESKRGSETLIWTSKIYLEKIALSASRRMLSSKTTWLNYWTQKKHWVRGSKSMKQGQQNESNFDKWSMCIQLNPTMHAQIIL